MITFNELHMQNHKISELANVLSYLMGERRMCDNEVTCSLFFEYVERVKEHLDMQDKHLYSKLLRHKEKDVCNTGKQFLAGSMEIKRIFAEYQKRWCPKNKTTLNVGDYERFRSETEEMFEIVLRRIQDETEKLYPLVRGVVGCEQIS